MTAPTGRELNMELALMLGARFEESPDETNDEPIYRLVWADGSPVGGGGRWWVARALACRDVPAYSSSLDALFGAGGPVEYARGKGMWVLLEDSGEGWVAVLSTGASIGHCATLPDPAAALATAIYEALKEMNDGD
jgi:hypothetical protein